MKDPMNTQRATDQAMPTAQDTVQANPMRPPADSPRTAKDAWRVFLSHPSPLILLAVLGVGGAWRWQLGGWAWVDAAVAFALWLAFPFIEWLIHVHVLHFKPIRLGRFTLDFYLPKTHRRHHAGCWSTAGTTSATSGCGGASRAAWATGCWAPRPMLATWHAAITPPTWGSNADRAGARR